VSERREEAFRVTSWRETASHEVQADLDGLLQPAFELAQRHLAKHHEFHPFGVALDVSGEQRVFAADMPEDRPASSAVLDALLDGLRGERDRCRAVALVSDIRAAELDGDAIRVALEHREGVAMAVFLPYVRRRRIRGGLEYGQLQAQPAEATIWI
jgi:hypothetical protein